MIQDQILYLTTEGLPQTVFDSQVVDHLMSMTDHGFQIQWLALDALRSYLKERKRQLAQLDRFRSRVTGQIKFLPIPRPRSQLATPFIAWYIRRLVSVRSPFIIHARNHDACRFALAMRRRFPQARVIFDVRGEAAAELEYFGDGINSRLTNQLIENAHTLECRAVGEAAHWFCVSRAMREHLCQAHPSLKREQVSVIPCVVSEKKFKFDPKLRNVTRNLLGLATDVPLLIYSGQLIQYQMPQETVKLVAKCRSIWPNLHFLMLTPQTEKASILLEQSLAAGQYTVLQVSHEKVNAYLNAADMALLIREPHLLNRVSCPTKFGEYVMTGLPVILTEDIGDCSAFVREHRTGIVLKHPNDEETLLAQLPFVDMFDLELRGRRAQAGVNFLSRDVHAATYSQVYSRLLSENCGQ